VEDWPLVAVHASLLHTGELLLFDAWEEPTRARTWDPRTGAFRDVTTPGALFCAGQVALADGRILVAGGHDSTLKVAGIKETNLFDPVTRTWTRLDDMATRRWYPAVTRLADNRVVAISGNDTWETWADTPEVMAADLSGWTELGGVSTADLKEDEYPLAFMLPDGRVLVFAPKSGESAILDVSAGTWEPTGLGPSPARNHSAAQVRPGLYLVSGGGESWSPAVTTAGLADFTGGNPRWQPVDPMRHPRYMHNLVVLPDGKVLAIGGSNVATQLAEPDAATLPAELFDPTTGTWTELAAMATPRMYHSVALLLPDGRVLAAGGGRLGGIVDFPSAEIFSPPYVFAADRPVIWGGDTAGGYGGTITISTPDADRVGRVSLVNLASVTHSIDMDQRYLELPSRRSGGSLTVTLPEAPALAPAGYYMLFIVDERGVPSEAHIVRLGEAPETVVLRGQPREAEARPIAFRVGQQAVLCDIRRVTRGRRTRRVRVW
jgi:hypothetical protein